MFCRFGRVGIYSSFLFALLTFSARIASVVSAKGALCVSGADVEC